jgi:hypothetical protein
MDTDGNGAVDVAGCADLNVFSNGTNFLSLYELDPGTTDDLIQTMYFPELPVSLTCTVFGCAPAQSSWVMPTMYDSPTSPAKVSAEFAMTVNSAVFIDSSRGCRVVGPAVDTVSGASFLGPAIAPESIASAFGGGLAVSTENAVRLPLPVDLAGTNQFPGACRNGGGAGAGCDLAHRYGELARYRTNYGGRARII